MSHDQRVTYHPTTLTIAATGTVSSSSGDLSEQSVVGIYIPTWDSGTIAFQSSVDGTNFHPVRHNASGSGVDAFATETLGNLNDNGSEAIHYAFDDNEIPLLSHARYLKIVAENTQAVAVEVKLIVRSVA